VKKLAGLLEKREKRFFAREHGGGKRDRLHQEKGGKRLRLGGKLRPLVKKRNRRAVPGSEPGRKKRATLCRVLDARDFRKGKRGLRRGSRRRRRKNPASENRDRQLQAERPYSHGKRKYPIRIKGGGEGLAERGERRASASREKEGESSGRRECRRRVAPKEGRKVPGKKEESLSTTTKERGFSIMGAHVRENGGLHSIPDHKGGGGGGWGGGRGLWGGEGGGGWWGGGGGGGGGGGREGADASDDTDRAERHTALNIRGQKKGPVLFSFPTL